MKKIIFLLTILLIISCYTYSQISFSYTDIKEFNTTLMRCTYLIEGIGEKEKIIKGTCFIVGKIIKSDTNMIYYPILVTAKHVLDDIKGESAFLNLRELNGDSISKPLLYEFRIRNKGKNNYISHPDDSIDVSVMYIELPKNIDIDFLPTDYIANEEYLKYIEFHPGDEVFCLGYPFGSKSTDYYYPILTSGKISSFPLFPLKIINNYLLDINIHSGNSGGPVYLYQIGRGFNNEIRFDTTITKIVGLLSGELYKEFTYEYFDEIIYRKVSMNIAVIIPSPFILEAINLLPQK